MVIAKLKRLPTFLWAERSSLMAVATKVAGAASSFLVIFIVARVSGAAVTGDYAIALSTATTVSLFAIMGLDLIVIRNISGDLRIGRPDLAWGALKATLVKVIPASVLCTAILAFGSRFAPQFGASPPTILAILGGILFFPLLRVAVAVFRAIGSTLFSQFIDSAHAHLMVLLTVVWVAAKLPITGPLVALFYSISVTVVAIASWLLLLRRTKDWPRGHKDDRPTVSTSWRIMTSTVAQSLTSWVLLAQVGLHLGTSEAGAYRVAGQIVLTIGLLVTTLGPIAAPDLAAQIRLNNIKAVWQHYLRSTRLMIFSAAIPVGLCLLIPTHLLSVFGPEFVIAATALWILSLGQVANAMAGPIGVLTVMSGNEHITLILSVVGLAFTAAISAILIPQFGLVGAATSAIVPTIARNAILLLMMRRKLKVA